MQGLKPTRILIAKEGNCSPVGKQVLEVLQRIYPDVPMVDRTDVQHNRIDLKVSDPLEIHRAGKKTLVIGVHKSAVRYSTEKNNLCPNFWHFSPYGYCHYECHYCYLTGTRGVRFSPTVKIFTNLHQILDKVDKIATSIGKPTAFYLGKLQDGLALDPLTDFSKTIIPFFANHKYARLTLLTKSSDVTNLLDLQHNGRSILSWTVNPSGICNIFEMGAPPLEERIEAMKLCHKAGYPVRALIMPLIPIENWKQEYSEFLDSLLTQVSLERLTMGGICSFASAQDIMEKKIGLANPISLALEGTQKSKDGRRRYPINLRIEMYSYLLEIIRSYQPNMQIGLCLEEEEVYSALHLTDSIGICNCNL
ncbi:MAG: SPL family radical SAM protein [Planctomycetota bacterium]|jgi:DNA repair photolyase